MSLKALGALAIVAAIIVAGLLIMHGHGGGVVHDWLRSLHGQR
jgi:hypothetical protein